MNRKNHTVKKILLVFSVFLILMVSIVNPVFGNSSAKNNKGFTKGVSFTNVSPVEKATFINFDKEGIIDDFAYLSAIPTAIFNDPSNGRVISHPILFYQDEMDIEDDKEKSLNAFQGLDYFMEDWMSYSDGRLDEMTLINKDKKDIPDDWDSENYFEIDSDDPYEIAKELSLHDWSYSDNAVIAVIDDKFEESNVEISNSIEGSLEKSEVQSLSFEVPQLNHITPQFKDFEVPDGYKYLDAKLRYNSFYIKPSFLEKLPVPAINITIPPGDPNIELFCRYNDEWMQVAATYGWNAVYGMAIEETGSYVYKNGPWRLGVTDVPTHEIKDNTKKVDRNIGIAKIGRYGTFFEALKNLKNTQYKVFIDMYPGKVIDVPEMPPFGVKNATFKLTWDNPSVNLGFSLIGPGGEEVLSKLESNTDQQVMHLDQLGECLENENYKLSVFVMDDIDEKINFEVEYSIKQGIAEKKADALTSATEGAILASMMNAPLIYTKSSEIPKPTEEVLYKLGVKDITIVDIGGHLTKEIKQKIKNIAKVSDHFINLKPIYDEIRKYTNSNDVVFSTLDPWTYWYVEKRKPAGEYPGAHFLGPAAFSAAHHGTPLLIVENHPQLSSSVVWHTEFWKLMERRSGGVAALPSVAEMYLTGIRVYDFLDEYGFDKEGKEMMVTIADKFDIGTPWDRVFVGKAAPGRIFGSPTDTSYWVSRSIFYPALIFENPATEPRGNDLIDGSSSKRRFPWWGKLGLKITEEAKEKNFKNPVLNTYVTYAHRFNERASKYWGWEYKTATGKIPGESVSFNKIDQGVMEKYTDSGSYFPDFTQSEVIPFYLEKGGYESVFSTNFESVMSNLNEGVLLWMGSAHGGAGGSGTLDFWNADSPFTHEKNPWRVYEWYLGSTEEPDTLTMENYGIIPMLFGNPTGKGLTGHGLFRTSIDIGLAKKPVLDLIGKASNLPFINYFAPEWLKDTNDYYDGVIGSVLLFKLASDVHTGYDFDESLDNIHSAGIVNGCCLLANKYLHLTMIRHGSVFQILDPWPTSWYTAWSQFLPRNIALGQTAGEAYVEGISHVGILYVNEPEPQWWVDSKQNVCFFGDPALRPLVPGTDYSTNNHWTVEETKAINYDKDISIAGHMPFGAESYPNEREPMSLLEEYSMLIVISIILILAVAIIFYIMRKNKK